MSAQQSPRGTSLFAFVVTALAVVGYFAGLQSPMKSALDAAPDVSANATTGPASATADAIPATGYSNMAAVIDEKTPVSLLTSLKSSVGPHAALTIEPAEKQLALATRERSRAFNGAPPTIPHPVEQRSTASCMACHGKGFKTRSLRIPRMSHAFLANCTQCHVESSPAHMHASLFRENTFQGLAAPESGPRAFAEAPPMIPHTTWMRNDCMSCHGDAGHGEQDSEESGKHRSDN